MRWERLHLHLLIQASFLMNKARVKTFTSPYHSVSLHVGCCICRFSDQQRRLQLSWLNNCFPNPWLILIERKEKNTQNIQLNSKTQQFGQEVMRLILLWNPPDLHRLQQTLLVICWRVRFFHSSYITIISIRHVARSLCLAIFHLVSIYHTLCMDGLLAFEFWLLMTSLVTTLWPRVVLV